MFHILQHQPAQIIGEVPIYVRDNSVYSLVNVHSATLRARRFEWQRTSTSGRAAGWQNVELILRGLILGLVLWAAIQIRIFNSSFKHDDVNDCSGLVGSLISQFGSCAQRFHLTSFKRFESSLYRYVNIGLNVLVEKLPSLSPHSTKLVIMLNLCKKNLTFYTMC